MQLIINLIPADSTAMLQSSKKVVTFTPAFHIMVEERQMEEFRELYRLHAKDIYRFAYFLCGNQHDAEDITSEVFTRAILGRKSLRIHSVKGYLLTIARNLYLESRRRKKPRSRLSESIIDPQPQPDQTIIGQEELTDLTQFLHLFSEEDRSALLLKSDGLSYREIAAILSISETTARVKVHRLRVRLFQWQQERENDLKPKEL